MLLNLDIGVSINSSAVTAKGGVDIIIQRISSRDEDKALWRKVYEAWTDATTLGLYGLKVKSHKSCSTTNEVSSAPFVLRVILLMNYL
jgi:hypothetical protein